MYYASDVHTVAGVHRDTRVFSDWLTYLSSAEGCLLVPSSISTHGNADSAELLSPPAKHMTQSHLLHKHSFTQDKKNDCDIPCWSGYSISLQYSQAISKKRNAAM
jgi:hypothetical protein